MSGEFGHGEPGPTIQVKQHTIVEKHFYWMPNTLEMFLAALTAVQDFHVWMEKGFANPNEKVPLRREAEITVYCHKELSFLLPALEKANISRIVAKVDNPMSLDLRDFDLAVKFDSERAYDLVKVAEKHVTQAFGIIIGSDPLKATPDLSNCKFAEPKYDILILPFPDQKQLVDFLVNNHPELETDYVDSATLEDSATGAWESIGKYRMVVGVRSGLTYLAASLGKGVVEIYPPDIYRDWLSKWSCALYQMIYLEPEKASASLVYRAVEAVWKRTVSHQAAQKVSTPTVPSIVDVESAASK